MKKNEEEWKDIQKDFILINRKQLKKRTKEGLRKAKLAGKQIGRPHSLTSDQVRGILQMLDCGSSYREVAKKYLISHTTVAKIKQDGVSRCDSIDKQNGSDTPIVILNTNYRQKKSGELFRTNFWVGKQSVAIRYLDVRKLDQGKVVSLNTFVRNYELLHPKNS